MKIQIKRDEVSKDTKNHLKFKKKLRKVLMQRDENKFIAEIIDDYLNGFADFDPLLDWKFRPVCGCEIEGMDELCFNLKHNNLFGTRGFSSMISLSQVAALMMISAKGMRCGCLTICVSCSLISV